MPQPEAAGLHSAEGGNGEPPGIVAPRGAAEAPPPGMTAYELERAARIEANKQVLHSLGLDAPPPLLAAPKGRERGPARPRQQGDRPAPPPPPEASRRSKRQRGEAPDPPPAAAPAGGGAGGGRRAAGGGRRGAPRAARGRRRGRGGRAAGRPRGGPGRRRGPPRPERLPVRA
jgi:hypothetical protein